MGCGVHGPRPRCAVDGARSQGAGDSVEVRRSARIPWSFLRVCEGNDSLGLLALVQHIPDDWVAWDYGGKRQPERMHSTLILNMTKPPHLERLRTLALRTPHIEVTVTDLTVTRVKRITDAEVYCIVASISSSALREFKEAWVAEEPEAERQKYVPYAHHAGDGHVSLAYIQSAHHCDAEKFVSEHASDLKSGRSLIVESVSYRDEDGQDIEIALMGETTVLE